MFLLDQSGVIFIDRPGGVKPGFSGGGIVATS
jgi:hypothetical protein